MAKEFSQNEKEIIKKDLIKACEFYWQKYGYRKIGIRELTEKVGISVGSFYDFFETKEHLFFETANSFGQMTITMAKSNIPASPTKTDFANRIKEIFKLLADNLWLLGDKDYEVFIRKLPPELVEKSFRAELDDFILIAELFGQKPKVNKEKISAAFYVLAISLREREIVTMPIFDEGIDTLIDCFVNQLFLENKNENTYRV